MAPLSEAHTREYIDKKLESAGWLVQDAKSINLFAALGVAVREGQTSTGPADYLLYLGGTLCGVIEAKKEGASLGGVSEQSARYSVSKVPHAERCVPDGQPLPFIYESTNHEIMFRDERDPAPRSRRVFHFHKPETLYKWLEEGESLRARLTKLPELNTFGLRDCQIDAVHGIEESLQKAMPRALLQMATGSGKTYTACTQIYRLAKYAKVNRVLFLVDRGNLGRQAHNEFQQYITPDDGRKFTELYNVHILGNAGIGDEIKVTISTIQRLYSKLSNSELDEEVEEHSAYELDSVSLNDKPREVSYNPELPIETFDVIIIDECHRSIYNLWTQVLDYFDAFLIGLTATPTKKTIGFFNQNLVSEYTHEDAVIDQVNVGYDTYRIKTEKTEQGGLIESGTNVEVRDRITKQKRFEILDQDEEYQKTALDRSVIAPNQIRTVIRAFKDKCLPECFPNRTWVPKTLIFAKDDDHADRIVEAVREIFAESNDFCKKVTYRVGKTTAENTIKDFRNSPRLRIAVTVDMIATGTDIKPLECVIFMRDVRSQAYYEQMKGRGTRVVDKDVLLKVTPDAGAKTRFVLVDAVGVTETDKTETKSLESKPSVSTEKLMLQIAGGDRSPESLQTLGNRLIRLDLKLSPPQRKQLNKQISDNLKQMGASDEELETADIALIAGNLIHTANVDHLEEAVKVQYGEKEVTDEERQAVYKPMADKAVTAFHSPEVRELIETFRRETDQLVDDSADELIDAGYDEEKAKSLIKRYQQFIADHKDELDAIQMIYSLPYNKRHLSYQQIEELAEEIKQPPYNVAPIEVWKAFEQLEKNKVKGVPAKELLTNIVSLIRFSTGLSDVLLPFPELVNQRFNDWIKEQGSQFNEEQTIWLKRIKDQIANNAECEIDDFELIPECKQDGGILKAQALFGKKLNTIVQELNGYLIA